MTVGHGIGGLEVVASEYLGEHYQFRFPPSTVKRYKQRTGKRYARDQRNWRTRGNGQYLISGRMVFCHPEDFQKLMAISGGK